MKTEPIDWEATMRATQRTAEKAAQMAERTLAETAAMSRRQGLLFGEMQKLQAVVAKAARPTPAPSLPSPAPEPPRPNRSSRSPFPSWWALLLFGSGVVCGAFFGS